MAQIIDNGVSEVTFDRPDWNQMIRLAEAGKVKTIIIKDMSCMDQDDLKHYRIMLKKCKCNII